MVDNSVSTVLTCNQIADLPSLAEKILKFGDGLKVWLFEGELGSGKTTIIKNICQSLGSKDQIASPTFSIINEYIDQSGNELYHFDFFRIENEQEANAIGCEDYFYSGAFCFIEWASKIPSLIPDRFLKIRIENLNGNRKFELIRND